MLCDAYPCYNRYISLHISATESNLWIDAQTQHEFLFPDSKCYWWFQTTLKELAASNQMQEQALLDAHERMEILENRNQSNERAMTQIRSILGSTASKDAARSKTAR